MLQFVVKWNIVFPVGAEGSWYPHALVWPVDQQTIGRKVIHRHAHWLEPSSETSLGHKFCRQQKKKVLFHGSNEQTSSVAPMATAAAKPLNDALLIRNWWWRRPRGQNYCSWCHDSSLLCYFPRDAVVLSEVFIAIPACRQGILKTWHAHLW